MTAWICWAVMMAIGWIFAAWSQAVANEVEPVHQRAPTLVRCLETSAVFLVAAAALLETLGIRDEWGISGMPTKETPNFMVEAFWSTSVNASVAVMMITLLAWRRHVIVAMFGLLTACWLADDQAPDRIRLGISETKSRPLASQDDDTKPIPATIRMAGRFEGIDVWLNGVNVGQTPIQTTLGELLARITDRDRDRRTAPDNHHTKWIFEKTRPGAFQPMIRLNDVADASGKYISINAWVENAGIPGYLGRFGPNQSPRASGRGGQRLDRGDPFRPYRLVFHVTFAEWEQAIDVLLERARLADYQVSEDWLAAIASYRHRGWTRLRQLMPYEPEMSRLLDDLTRWQFGLSPDLSSDAAWQIVERIRSQAASDSAFYTDTPAGRALRLMIDRLDPQQVADEFVAAIESRQTSSLGTGDFDPVDGESHFRLELDGPARFGTLEPETLVLVHLVGFLDQYLDEQDDSRDNIIEQVVVPAVMRLQYRDGSWPYFDLAAKLGGSVFENFLFRHDLSLSVDDDSIAKIDYGNGYGPVVENRWFLKAADYESPAGARFRTLNKERLFEWARKLILSGKVPSPHAGFHGELDFLFLETESGSPLAVEFWDEVHSSHVGNGNDLREIFLRRLGNHATPEMYSDLLHQDVRNNARNVEYLARNLPPSTYSVIIRRTIDALKVLEAPKRQPGDGHMSSPQHYAFYKTLDLIGTNNEQDALMAWEAMEIKSYWDRVVWFSGTLKWSPYSYGNLPSPAFLRIVATRAEPELRVLLAESLRHELTRERMEILKLLEADTDEQVAEAARLSREFVEELRHRPLPTTGLKPVSSW